MWLSSALNGEMKVKGKVVDWLSERAEIVIRFQGGHNAGHTLVIDGISYRLSLLPAGVLRPEKLSLIGNGVVLDPWALLAEIKGLGQKGIRVTPDNLRISERTSLILPIHRDMDAARERSSGSIGTTQRGIGPAYEDKVGRRALRLIDLADQAVLKRKITILLDHHNALRMGLGGSLLFKARSYCMSCSRLLLTYFPLLIHYGLFLIRFARQGNASCLRGPKALC